MFGGGDMSKMMKQLGMDMEEIDADKVEVQIGDKKLVFSNPELSKIEAQGQEIFQLQGSYDTKEKGPSEEDIEIVMNKTEASREDAIEALKQTNDITEAVMELS